MVGVMKSDLASGEASESFNPTVSFNNTEDPNSLHVTIHRLNDKNYMEWAQSVKPIMDGKGRLEHLTGEVQKPNDKDPTLKIWLSENSLIIAWLINSMEPPNNKGCVGGGS